MNPGPVPPLLAFKGLSLGYPDGFHLEISSLELSAGKIYSLSGPNGSGKTTLLKVLALLLDPPGGEVRYRGRLLPDSSRGLLEIRRKMTLVEQSPYLFKATVEENLAYGLKVRGCGRREIEKRVVSILDLLDLRGFRGRRVGRLSAGEKQKVALARALIVEPEMLFLDEPTANVDRPSIEFIEEKIGEFHRRRPGLVVWATHSLEQAYRVGDEVLCLLEGRLAPGTIDNLFFGEVKEVGGETFFAFGRDLKAVVSAHRPGRARMLIHPEEIIVSLSPLDSSARNSFAGRVTRIGERGEKVAIETDIGVSLVAIITPASYRRFGLELGSPVYLTFKASAVSVF